MYRKGPYHRGLYRKGLDKRPERLVAGEPGHATDTPRIGIPPCCQAASLQPLKLVASSLFDSPIETLTFHREAITWETLHHD
jgi:hypothetical protein